MISEIITNDNVGLIYLLNILFGSALSSVAIFLLHHFMPKESQSK